MTDEEIRSIKGKLRILNSNHLADILYDVHQLEESGVEFPWSEVRKIYKNKLNQTTTSKYRQKDLEEQIAEEKNEKPNIEE